MQRIVVTSCIVALAALLMASTAWAGPDTGSVQPILPKTAKPTTLFGYSGQRPLDATTSSGIARPTPAPRIQTAAFGAATVCLPARPRMVTPTPAPRCFGSASDDLRFEVRECSGGSCSPCDPCAPYCPTTRVNDDPLSISPHQWSSGYHDGEEVRHEVRECGPCGPYPSRPIYRSPCTPCEPCAEPCDPCTTRVVVRRPRRIVRQVCATPCYSPCYTPCRTVCAPRVRFGIAPYWGWGRGCGWGLGWGWGGGWGGGWGWGGGCW